jgi:large subunit ribosomal protein L21
MANYAVIETGGKQYRVAEGDLINVERVTGSEGDKVDLNVLAVSSGEGALALGKGSVAAEVVGHLRGKKLIAFKKKRRKGYSKRIGHRQELTQIKITKVG